jgi:acyl carrier protein phosphodiesterase
MNFLAHAYLSFGHPGLIVGNMISDFVKGSAKFSYPPAIQKGIILHRDIDNFTDTHAATHKAKQVFRPAYRLYSGAIMDIIYDHYLATDENIFSEKTLKIFSQHIYECLDNHLAQLPPQFVHAFSYMKTDDWLFHYRERKGIEKSLKGLIRRAAYLNESDTAFLLFNEHYDFIGECYKEFIEDVKEFAKQKIAGIIS